MMDVSFGTSGIRGVVGENITPELALALGQVITKKRGSKVVIGRDTRPSGAVMESALIAGINFLGGSALRLGVVPTPTTAIATRARANSGIMITASHNPPQYNGFKFYNRLGEEISREEEREIENLLRAKKFASPELDGFGDSFSVADAVDKHIELAFSLTDRALIEKKKPKIVVDCGNGAACSIAPFMLREVGCRVVGFNAEPSGTFSRNLEPNSESLEDACAVVRSSGADMGIGYDADGDRVVVMDERGEVLGLDEQLSLISGYLLGEKGGSVVSTVEASLAVKEAVEKNGGNFIITEVGSRNVAERMRGSGAIFGGEPCGEYIFPEEVLSPDGMLATLKFVELMCREGKLGKLRKEIKKYPMRRAKFNCSNRSASMERIKGRITGEFKGDVNEKDGVRIDLRDGWLLVRASGTESAIRVTCEHKSERELEKIFRRAEGIVKEGLV
ncbi:MAG: phosphoglucosamine mutase [Candidatus Micrarchaeota archaeon]|nr:phosphoglucosamine mutase [Candidatus Micrarchaeota archaeon]